jgi:hypothetical protein
MVDAHSAALRAARLALRALIPLNWLYGAAIALLVMATMVAKSWTFTALGVEPGSIVDRLIVPLRFIAALGLTAVPLNDAILRRLLAIVDTVRGGDPFVAVNADRLRIIAWSLFALQAISMIVGAIGKAVAEPGFPLHLDAGFSASGWLAVLLAFVLAQVFSAGTELRDDLQGTV